MPCVSLTVTDRILVWYACPPPFGRTEKVRSVLSVANASSGTETVKNTSTDLLEPCLEPTLTVDLSKLILHPEGGEETVTRRVSSPLPKLVIVTLEDRFSPGSIGPMFGVCKFSEAP